MMQTGVDAAATTGRSVLVTGGTGAIGSEIIRLLCASSEAGLIIANFARDENRAATLKSETGCEIMRADVGDEEQVENLFRNLPPLWAIVHAAGASQNALLLQQSAGEWRETLRVNADGAFLVVRAALRYLQDGGRLVLLASRVGERGNAGQGAYAASKAALLALTRCAAREGADRGLCINAICPGFVKSPLTASLPQARLEEFKRRSVFGEFGSGRDVAGAVQWLLSNEAAHISGQTIHCDSRI